VAAAEAQLLAVVARDPDTGEDITYEDVCARLVPAGPCFFNSLFGPGTPWNLDGSKTAPQTLPIMRNMGSPFAPHPSAQRPLHLAVDTYYATARLDPRRSTIFGKVTPLDGVPGIKHIGAMAALRTTFLLKGVERKTLTFRVWDFVTGQADPMSKQERWEKAVMDQAERLEAEKAFKSVQISRTGTRSVAFETLRMVVWSIPLVMVNMSLMFSYVAWVFLRKPFKIFMKSRIKLAMVGVAGVQMASISGICFATAIQVPATFGSQFVMFIVLGIGLDGVFLMTDTFGAQSSRRAPAAPASSAFLA
jgi:hypothetical protein